MSDEKRDDASGTVLGDNAGVHVSSSANDLPVDFGGFVVGLYQSALVCLGEAEHPDMSEPFKDIEAAKHTIDILKMLQQKTRNNLDEEEDQLMRGLLYKLHVAYVNAEK